MFLRIYFICYVVNDGKVNQHIIICAYITFHGIYIFFIIFNLHQLDNLRQNLKNALFQYIFSDTDTFLFKTKIK